MEVPIEEDKYSPYFVKLAEAIDALTELTKGLETAPHDQARVGQLVKLVSVLASQVSLQRDLLIDVIDELNLCVRQPLDE